MKKLILLSVLVLGQLAIADEWPYDSVCRRYNARSETFHFDEYTGEKVFI
jgi:hypothetical protein